MIETTDPTPPRQWAVLLNLLGLLLAVLGLVGVNVAAWLPHLGLGVTSATCAGVGVLLAMREG